MALKEQILKQLRENGGYVSGEELSERLNVSRTAVWKCVAALRETGYAISSATNRGYRLDSSPDLYNADEITAGLETQLLGRHVFCYDSIDSTNEEAKRQALRGAPGGSLFIAEQQTAGKGRLGRSWVSAPGAGMWFSILLRPGILPLRVAATTLLAGLAVCESIRSVTGCRAMIKWPNDIVIGSKKVCGILAELSAEMERVEFLVVGIGINANTAGFPESLQEKATSLRLESGKPVRRVTLLQDILARFETLLKENAAPTPSFMERYRSLCASLNRQVAFARNGQQLTGTAEDVTAQGELLVRLPDGGLEKVFSGEVSVQGFYGER